jgi:ABC-type nitrate/sulfonate/bicarbonate transport system ATPase subunit
VEDVSHHYRLGGTVLSVLEHVSLTAEQRQFVSLLGPSGSGKSTLLKLIAGLEEPSGGTIQVMGERRRLGRVGWMPQHDLLHPWLDALGNAAVGLEVRGVSRAEARERARALFAPFGLTGFEQARPRELSGGMRQRVALARTVLASGELILLDEPFGALDAMTRAQMHAWLLETWPALGKTCVMVTHDVEEALLLSDRVYVLSARPGRVVARVESPFPRPRATDILADPAFVARKLDLLRRVGRAA